MMNTVLLHETLDFVLEKIPDLLGVLVVDMDGFIIAEKCDDSINEALIGAVMSVIEQTTIRIKRVTKTRYGSGTLDTNDFRLFYLELGGKRPALFVIIADPYAELERIIPYIYLPANKISRIMNKLPVNSFIPDFAKKGDCVLDLDTVAANKNTVSVLLIGPKEAGKTSFLTTYNFGDFSEDYNPTIGVSSFKKELVISSDFKIDFLLFEIAGMKVFSKLRKYYYRKMDNVIIMADYSRPETINNITEWIEEARYFLGRGDVNYIIAGNKVDLINDESDLRDSLIDISINYDCEYFDSSSVTGQGLDEIFTYILNQIL